MSWDDVQQVVRIVMNGVGMWLAAKGLPDNIVQAIIGVGMSSAAVAWWYFWNRSRSTAPAA